jgi:hypothetical protein
MDPLVQLRDEYWVEMVLRSLLWGRLAKSAPPLALVAYPMVD